MPSFWPTVKVSFIWRESSSVTGEIITILSRIFCNNRVINFSYFCSFAKSLIFFWQVDNLANRNCRKVHEIHHYHHWKTVHGIYVLHSCTKTDFFIFSTSHAKLSAVFLGIDRFFLIGFIAKQHFKASSWQGVFFSYQDQRFLMLFLLFLLFFLI